MQDWKKLFNDKWADLIDKTNEPLTWKRLYHCQAQYAETADIVVLMSYTTICAIYDKHKNVVYVCNYYSPTTQQQISKFINGVLRMYDVNMIVYSYLRSNNTCVFDLASNSTITYFKRDDTLYVKDWRRSTKSPLQRDFAEWLFQ